MSQQMRRSFPALWLWCLLLAAPVVTAQALPIRIEEGKSISGNIFGFKQDILVDGTIEDELSCIACNIHIKGQVNGNISVLGGSVRIYKSGSVKGNLVCIGGTLDVHEQSQLPGKIIHYLNPEAENQGAWLTSVKGRAAWFFAQTLILFLLVIGIFYLFPNQINEASFHLSQDLVRATIIGSLTLTAFILGMFVSFLLMAVMIGFPLFLIFFTGFCVVATFGGVVVFYRLGQVLEHFGRMPMVVGILLAIILAGLLAFLPTIRLLTLFLFLVFGMGIVIDTRFGTNKQWFTRKARYWSAG